MHKSPFQSFATAVMLGLIVVVCADSALGQIRPRSTVEAMLADRYAALARETASSAPQEGSQAQDDYLLAGEILLDLALQLKTDDPELWLLRRELAQQRSDGDGELNALKQYAELRPQDDVAKFDLIVLWLDRDKASQTLDGRVAKVEGLLNSETGKKLSKPLQSRLASYVAASAVQIGDAEVDRGWLRYAMDLDPVNYDAAKMLYDLIRQRNRPPLEQAQALYGVLRANPSQDDAHHQLALLLLAQGAYRQAAKQFEIVQTFRVDELEESFYHNWALSLAASGDRQRAVELMHELELRHQMLAEQAEQTEQTEQAEQPTDGDQPDAAPAPIPLQDYSVDMQLLAYCINLEPTADFNTSEAPLRRIETQLRAQWAKGDPQGDAKLVWLLTWANLDAPDADELVNQLTEARGQDDALVRRLHGWRALHKGDFEQASHQLEATANQDAFAALGLAHAARRKGEKTLAVKYLKQTVELEPSGLAALRAVRQLRADGQTATPTDLGRQLVKLMDTWEFALVHPKPQERPWLMLDIEVEPKQASFLEPLTATVRMHNLTDFPLAMGVNGAAPTNVFLFVSPRRHGQYVGRIQPLVIDLNRRFRLEPRSAIEIKTRLDHGAFASILTNLAGERITYSVTALLDPRLTAEGRWVTGPMGASDSEELLEVGGGMPNQINAERWLKELEQPDPAARAKAMANLLSFAPTFLSDLQTDEQTRQLGVRIVEVVNRAYPKLDDVSRAWTMLFVPREAQYAKLFEPLIDLAKRSDHPMVRIAYLVSQVNDPDSTEMADALRHDQFKIREFARVRHLHLQWLREEEKKQQDASNQQGFPLGK